MPSIRTISVSGSIPSITQLALGDLAVNTFDGKAYLKRQQGNRQTVLEIGSGITPVSASYALSSSFAVSSSYAANGGVTQLLAGASISLSPSNGLGQVTITSTGGSGGTGNTSTGSYGSFYDTGSQTNPVGNVPRSMSFNTTDITNGVSISGSTSPFNTYIKTQNAGVYDIQFSAQFDRTNSGTDKVYIWLRKNGVDVAESNTSIVLTGGAAANPIVAAWNWFVNSAAGDYYQIMWESGDTHVRLLADPTPTYGPALPSIILTVNRVDQFLSNTGSFSGSFTGQLFGTSSWAVSASQAVSSSRAISSSFALTSSYVNNLSQAVTIGNITTIPSTENTLNVYPSFAGGTGEGGQILLAASGGLYSSASMLDTYQNQFRLLKGTNTGGSTVAYIITDLHSGNTQFAGAVTASAYSGLPNSYLYVTRNTNQTIGEGNWANQDIIFNNVVVNSGIPYNPVTGTATLTGGRVYRITARLAWSAAAAYLLQYSCYTSGNTQIGPTVEIVQSTNPSNNISDGTLDFIYAPSTNTDIKIRTTGATSALSGEYIREDLNTQFIIQQIA